MKSVNLIKDLISQKRNLLEKDYHVKTIGIFGSYRNDKASKKSDLDVLVEFSKTPTLFKFIQLERYLSRTVGIKVDLVTRKALKPFIKNEILKEVVFV